MKRRNKKVEYEIIRPEPITDEALSVLESLKRYTDDMREQERIQEQIDNLNVSPLQQRINKIRKIADEAKERIDRMEDRGPWFRPRLFPEFKDYRLDSIGVHFSSFSKQWERDMEILREMDKEAYTLKEVQLDSNADITSIVLPESVEPIDWETVLKSALPSDGKMDLSPPKDESEPNYPEELRKRGWNVEM